MYFWQIRRASVLNSALIHFIEFSGSGNAYYFHATCSFNYRGNLQDEFLQLVCRRHRVCTAIHQLDSTRPNLLTVEDLLKLQEDVASLYLSGRPKIDNISSIHIPFTFRTSKHIEAHTLTYVQFVLCWMGGEVARTE